MTTSEDIDSDWLAVAQITADAAAGLRRHAADLQRSADEAFRRSGVRCTDEEIEAKKVDRILWNRRGDGVRDVGDIDEIVLHGVDVHIEQMDPRCWWIGIYRGDDRWAGNFSCDSRGRMTFSEQEDDLGFDKDEEHDR